MRDHSAAELWGIRPTTVRRLLEKRTFLLTESDLERLFIPIAERAGWPEAETQARVNGYHRHPASNAEAASATTPT